MFFLNFSSIHPFILRIHPSILHFTYTCISLSHSRSFYSVAYSSFVHPLFCLSTLSTIHLSIQSYIHQSIRPSPVPKRAFQNALPEVPEWSLYLSVRLVVQLDWRVLSEALCNQCVVPVWLFKVIFWLGYCNSLMNPVIYACSSREFHRAFLRILRCSRFRRQEPQFLRQTFLALQSVHATSASIATNFSHSSRRLAVGVAHGTATFMRSNSSPTSPTTEVKNDIPMVRIQ